MARESGVGRTFIRVMGSPFRLTERERGIVSALRDGVKEMRSDAVPREPLQGWVAAVTLGGSIALAVTSAVLRVPLIWCVGIGVPVLVVVTALAIVVKARSGRGE